MFHFRPGQRHWLPTILVLYPGRGARLRQQLLRLWPLLVTLLLLDSGQGIGQLVGLGLQLLHPLHRTPPLLGLGVGFVLRRGRPQSHR